MLPIWYYSAYLLWFPSLWHNGKPRKQSVRFCYHILLLALNLALHLWYFLPEKHTNLHFQGQKKGMTTLQNLLRSLLLLFRLPTTASQEKTDDHYSGMNAWNHCLYPYTSLLSTHGFLGWEISHAKDKQFPKFPATWLSNNWNILDN